MSIVWIQKLVEIVTPIAPVKLLGLRYTRNMVYRGAFTPRYPVCLFFVDTHVSGRKTPLLPHTCSLRRWHAQEYVPIRAVARLDSVHPSVRPADPPDMHADPYAPTNASLSVTTFYTLQYPLNAPTTAEEEEVVVVVRNSNKNKI